MSILYSRLVMDWLPSLVEFLALDLFYAGGLIFTCLQLVYEWRFDTAHRMKSSSSRDKRNDHEDETVVARNKRPPHCPLRAFPSVRRASSLRINMRRGSPPWTTGWPEEGFRGDISWSTVSISRDMPERRRTPSHGNSFSSAHLTSVPRASRRPLPLGRELISSSCLRTGSCRASMCPSTPTPPTPSSSTPPSRDEPEIASLRTATLGLAVQRRRPISGRRRSLVRTPLAFIEGSLRCRKIGTRRIVLF